ncbi:MAG: hypothetical protein EOO77_39380 [Oxalobacteraceae bacterium]|nr:MAG: hypothetical protein EOO77_39380 [Oxalobacteraceae bacterium]
MKLVLEGLPERIQEAADILDRAFPGAIDWSDVAKLGRDHTMRLEGATLPHDRMRRPPGRIKRSSSSAQVWKLDSSAARDGDQRNQLCAPPFSGGQS